MAHLNADRLKEIRSFIEPPVTVEETACNNLVAMDATGKEIFEVMAENVLTISERTIAYGIAEILNATLSETE